MADWAAASFSSGAASTSCSEGVVCGAGLYLSDGRDFFGGGRVIQLYGD